MATIPLEEIAPGASIRFTVVDGVQYLSIRDFIMHLCDKNQNDTAKVWRNLSEEKKKEVKPFLLNFKFPGQGQQEQPVITFPGAIQLSMSLPGENAKKNRSAMSKILVRYFAGDRSLIKEIESNAESNDPVAQMARDSLASEQKDVPLQVSRKREFEQLEYDERVAALERTRAETEKIKADTEKTKADAEKIKADAEKTKADTNAQKLELYASLCGTHPRIDDRARLLFKDVVMNSIAGPAAAGQLQIAAGGPPADDPSLGFLTISTVASKMGYRLDSSQLMKVGMRVKNAYRFKYREDPPKHEQFVNGGVRMVNTYQSRDRDILEKEIHEFVLDNDLDD